jgi:hypothetical protein
MSSSSPPTKINIQTNGSVTPVDRIVISIIDPSGKCIQDVQIDLSKHIYTGSTRPPLTFEINLT